MEESGTLIIRVWCIRIMGPSRAVISMQQVVNRIRCLKPEAVAMVQEHKKQAGYAGQADYDYQWQVDPEDANKW